MKTIANNTVASAQVISKYNDSGAVRLYECDEDCDQIDMIYIDNGNKECFTLDKSKKNRGFNPIVLRGGEMCLVKGGDFLEELTIEPNVQIEDDVLTQIKHAIQLKKEEYALACVSLRDEHVRTRAINSIELRFSQQTGVPKNQIAKIVRPLF